jgi:UDP-glucose-4-epimerase GalE
MRDNNVNILVTGGAGYIGSHVCKQLATKGFMPITYDNLSRGNKWAVKWGPLEPGDVGDAVRVREVLEKYRPIAMMHFAAYAYVGESVEQPLLYYKNNLAATVSLLTAMIAVRRIPVVFSSSCATYGTPDYLPISEGHPQRPINPYGHSKLFVEQLLADLEAAHSVQWISLRYFNAAGADPDGEIGEAHDPETHLIPLVIRAAQTGSAVQIFGADYETSDGTCVRDYVHVSDIADAHVRALDHLLDGRESCALNLANTYGHSVRDVISAAEKVCGDTIRVEILPRRPGDPPVLIGDSRRARMLLGWKPMRSELDAQIADAWRWMQQRQSEIAKQPSENATIPLDTRASEG